MSIVTPAIAGPFDLGNVVVRVPLFLDPETAQIHPRTNDIPDVFGGAKLDIRSVFVNVNRDDFTLNGTNCRKEATAGVVNGGGANPLDPGAYLGLQGFRARSRATGCRKLKFRPKLNIRLFGKTQRAKHPKLRAVLKARGKDANIRKASVALPHALFLDQASLGDGLHPGPVRRREMPEDARSTARRAPSRRCSANRSKARSTCALRTTRCRTWSPTSRARSTSTWSAASTASRAASAPPSAGCPTSRFASSC